jgi:hypothetical protein
MRPPPMEAGLPEMPTVVCAECGAMIGEDQAQAIRWGVWDEFVDLYPYCASCAERVAQSDTLT